MSKNQLEGKPQMGPAFQAALSRAIILELEELQAMQFENGERIKRAQARLEKVRRGEWP